MIMEVIRKPVAIHPFHKEHKGQRVEERQVTEERVKEDYSVFFGRGRCDVEVNNIVLGTIPPCGQNEAFVHWSSTPSPQSPRTHRSRYYADVGWGNLWLEGRID